MKKISTAILIFVLLLQLLPFAVAQTDGDPSDNEVTVRVTVHVYDVDAGNKLANVSIHFGIFYFPYKTDNIILILLADEDSVITCSVEDEKSKNGWCYFGQTEPRLWLLEGTGEPFPFDVHTIRVKIFSILSIGSNFTLMNSEHSAFFTGPNTYYLKNIWTANDLAIPNINTTNQSTSFVLRRTENEAINSFLRYYVPTIACYFLLGSALLFDPKDGISSRLKIFLSIFFFVPTYLTKIQEFMPYTTSISFPEILLINLLVSTAILCVFSAIGNYFAKNSKSSKKRQQKQSLGTRTSDGFGLILAMLVLIVLYWKFSDIMVPQLSALISYIILPAYIFWIPFVDKKLIDLNWTTFRAVLFGISITLLTYLISLFLPLPLSIIGIEIGATITGFIVAWYLQSGDKSAIISCLSGILGSLIAGVIIGFIAGERLFGVGGVAGIGNGLISLGSLGYFYAVFSTMAGLLAVRLKAFFDSRKNKEDDSREIEYNPSLMEE
ncbi:MAG: hypothetical protein ACOWW1_06805 [archaeon]